MVKALFVSQHNGCASFLLFGPSIEGRQVFCRFRDEAWHRQARFDGRFKHLTDASFEAEVIGEIGLVHDGSRAVDLAVIQAVQAEISRVVIDNGSLVKALGTGFKDESLGWVVKNLTVLPVGEVQELDWDPLLADLFGLPLKAVGLAAREAAMNK